MLKDIQQELLGRRVLITGVCGTVGRALLEHLRQYDVRQIVGIDNNETAVFELNREHAGIPNMQLALADIRNFDSLRSRITGIDYVFHSAALKHVSLCEDSPGEAIATNITAMQNMIEACRSAGVKRMLFTSSDKAVNPTNVMGASKLMGERMMTAAAMTTPPGGPIFASTRFGNVLGSRGSVVPVFARQIASGQQITLTDPAMTRFIMTIEDAANLVVSSMFRALGGEIFVSKMVAVSIHDLAEVMRAELAPRFGHRPEDIEITQIGAQAGEKIYEELTNSEEVRRTLENEDLFIVTPPLLDPEDPRLSEIRATAKATGQEPYRSDRQDLLSREKLASYLRENRVLDDFKPGA